MAGCSTHTVPVSLLKRALFSIQATGCSARISALRYPDRAEIQSADWPMGNPL